MRLVAADTGPLRYLIQIGQIELLPRLFERIFVPSAVCEELSHPSAPETVRAWIGLRREWLDVSEVAGDDPSLNTLDHGEKAVIALASTLHADLILVDDRSAAAIARAKGFEVTGTLGVLDLARSVGWLTSRMHSGSCDPRISVVSQRYSMP